MKIPFTPRTVAAIAAILGVPAPAAASDRAVTNVTIDSRTVEAGSLFVALRGERVDGHNYIASALRNGAVTALSELPIDGCMVVDDCKKALATIAASIREEVNPVVVAVTGSVGKTTTKEFVYAVLSDKYKTHRSEGNHNNDIGLPLSIMSLPVDASAAVYELGMSAHGEIEYLSRLTRPDLAVITNIGSMHIENLGSREGIRDAKMEIRRGLRPQGRLILNGDEPLLAGIEGAYYVSTTDRGADLYIDNLSEGEYGSAFDLTMGGDKAEKVESVIIPTLGAHNVFDAALAYAVGLLLGMGEFEIRRGLLNFRNTGMRQNIYNHGDYRIIEDCYNAGPESVAASLRVLSDMKSRNKGRAVAVLGDMRELGEHSFALHREVGGKTAFLDLLVTVGDEAARIADGAIEAGLAKEKILCYNNISYENSPEIIVSAIRERVRKGDNILFKASRALRLERIVEAFKK